MGGAAGKQVAQHRHHAAGAAQQPRKYCVNWLESGDPLAGAVPSLAISFAPLNLCARKDCATPGNRRQHVRLEQPVLALRSGRDHSLLLSFPQRGITAVLLEKHRVISALNNCPAIEHYNLVGVHDR